jgi:hypothetical protein
VRESWQQSINDALVDTGISAEQDSQTLQVGCTVEMVKLITPMGMLITVALLAIYAAYAFWTAYIDQSGIYGLLGGFALVACYGTAMLRAWSQYLVYLLTALFIAAWCYSVYSGAAVGYFSFFFSSRLLAAKALAPGLALVVLSCLASCDIRLQRPHGTAAGEK